MRDEKRKIIRSFTVKCFLLFFCFLLASSIIYGQSGIEEKISSTIYAETSIPVMGDQEIFNLGAGGSAAFEYSVLPFLAPFLHGGGRVLPIDGLDTLSLFDFGGGAAFIFRPADRIRLRADLFGGVYTSRWRDYGTSGLFFGTRGIAGYRITPALTLSLHGGFSDYLSRPEPFLRSVTAGISVSMNFSEFGNDEAKVDVQYNQLEPVFPVFYSFYDENSFGAVEIRSREEVDIRDVKVSLFIPEYMSQPRECGFFEELEAGGTVTVPLYALFNDDVLELTENTKGRAEMIVEYRLFGFKRSAELPINLTMYHRNAMTWEDDRKAAAFVSPTDPAVLWFSRFAAGIVRNRTRGSINKNLQYGMGMFEALRLYGINYVIDPNSAYVDLSEQSGTVDYLQFPHQTLFYRGGDCDDLSILYSALLESVGIRTGFITIPGHIYMAFGLDISEEEARENFYDPSMLVYIDGEAWVPVEITMVKEGFLKAWRVGAKEWADNIKTGDAVFFPMGESWKKYPPVSIPNVNPRFALPNEVETIQKFDSGMDRYVAREIEPLRARIVKSTAGTEEERQNRLGILFGSYGMLDEAWEQFSIAAKAGHPPAWVNLGNVAFLQKDYKLGVSYYEWALKLNPKDPLALLGLARCEYELENLDNSDAAYAKLQREDPVLASEFGYLASILGGEGRAWSFTERLSSTVWAEQAVDYPDIKSIEETDGALAMGIPEATIVDENDTITEEEVVEQPIETEESPAVDEQPVEEEPEPEPAVDEQLVEEEPEPEPAVDEQPVEEEPEPEQKETETEAPPAIAETVPVDTELAEKAARETETGPGQPEPEPEEPEPEGPPRIAETMPEEPASEAETEADTAAEALPSTVTAAEEPPAEEEPPADAPPEIASKLPSDKELEEKAELEAELEAEREAEKEAAEAEPEREEIDDEYIAALLTEEPDTEPPAAEEELPYIEEYLEGKIISETVVDTFSAAEGSIGSWEIGDTRIIQTDKDQLYAKAAVPAVQGDMLSKYSFSARSTGRGWTGLGAHIYRDRIVTNKGYGAGNSILVWLTRDPIHNDDGKTRLQLYRSYNDTDMVLLESTVVPDSIFDMNTYEIFFNKVDDTVSVRVNGTVRLEVEGFSDFTEGEYVVFRTLDTAEFENFRMEVIQWNESE